jgi:hypothetical protein
VFLIFGIKRRVKRMATVFALCSRCGAPAAQVVARRTTWLALFFIPVVPFRTTYLSTCTLCGTSIRLDKEEAMRTVALAQHSADAPTPGLVPGSPPPSDHRSAQ